MLGSKSKFNTSSKVIRTTDSISYLQNLSVLTETFQADTTTQVEVLVHLGNIADKLQTGNQVFLNQNFSALRVQKLAFAAQSQKNVEINKDKMVEIVKKNYKGNWETYKRHNNITNFHNENKSLEIPSSGNPLSSKIIQLKDDPHSYFKYLKISQMSGN